jgi:carbon monoxide dehydrogenase subunit G
VKGEGRVTLTDEDGGTRVTIRGEAQVGGVVAAVGQRLLGAVARMLMEQFFSAFEAELAKKTSQ